MSEANKIFVGGLDYNLTSDDLRLYFSKFGGIDDAVVLVNDKNGPFPGRSRGFGFITFNEESAIKKVMDSGPHTLGEKTMDIKVAVPKDKIGARGRNGGGMGDVNEKTTKLFVGGIRNDMTSEELKEAFLDDGVVSADVLMDRGTGKGRGFAFVVFDSEETVEALAKEHFRMIGDKQVEMKKAMPASRLRDSDRSRGYDDYGRGGGGGPMRNNRGGFRGGDRGGFRGGDRGGYDGGMNGMGGMPGGGMPYNQSPGWNMMNQGMNQGYNANGGYSGAPYGQNYGNYGNYGGNQGYGAGAGGRSAGGYGSNMGGSYGSFDQTSQAAQPDSSAAFHQLQQAVQNFVASTNTQPASNSYPGYGQTGTQAPAPAADNYAYGGQQTSPSPASQRAKQSAPYYR